MARDHIGSMLLLAGAAFYWPQSACAQEAAVIAAPQASEGLEDIVVTARKRSENLQDVPVAISAIGGADLANKGVFETTDLSSATPNLQVNSPYGTTQPNFALRGVGLANEFNSNAASPVGVYVDEVYQATRASHGQQLYDIDRVEIVRGPQGTLYGRNTTGGAVNFITRQPSLDSGASGYLTAGIGNYARRNAEGAVDLTLVPETLGMRIAGTYVNSKGYVKNLSGPDSGGPESYGVRGILRFVPRPGIDISLKLYAARTKGGQENAIIANADPDNVGPVTFGVLGQAFGLSYDRHALSNDRVEADGAGYALTRAEGAVLKAAFELSDTLSVTTISGYDSGRYAQLPTTDCDGSPLDLCHVGYDSNFKGFNQEFRVNYNADRLKFVGGLYYGWDRIDVANNYHLYGILDTFRQAFGLPATYFNPAGFGVIPDPTALPTPIDIDTQYSQTRRSKAIYGEGVYDFSEALSLTVGLRYTKDTNHYYDGLATLFDATGTPRLVSVSATDGLVPPGPNVVTQELKKSSDAFSGRGILSYKPGEGILLYASYSRGYRAGSFNGTAFQSNAQVNFVPPEKLSAYEAGLKSRFFDNKMQANASLFYYDYKGQQVQQVVGERSLTALGSLDGTIKGAEIELEFRPIGSLQLALSGGYLHSRYKGGQFLSGIPVGGNRFPFAPKYSLNASFDWDAINAGTGKIVLHGDTSYTGTYSYDPFGDRQATGVIAKGGGDYWLLNARMSYVTDAFTVAAWIKNLTDTYYYPYILNLEAGYGLDLRTRSAPRTYGVEATIRF